MRASDPYTDNGSVFQQGTITALWGLREKSPRYAESIEVGKEIRKGEAVGEMSKEAAGKGI